MKNVPIGEVLKEYGYITEEQLQEALALQKEQKGKRLGQLLLELGYVKESQMLSALGARLSLQMVDLGQQTVDISAVEKIPKQLALTYNILAFAIQGNNLSVAVNDPLNFYALEDIRQLTGMNLVVFLSELVPLKNALDYYYAEVSARLAASQANEVTDEDTLDTLDMGDDLEGELDSDVPVIRLLNTLILRAYNINASDIHIEPSEGDTLVRMRVDGGLVDYVSLKHSLHVSVIARLKIMSGMDIAEKRIPQDGHFKLRLDQDDVNMRVSVIPTVFGEKSVIRLLSNRSLISNNTTFGMLPEDYEKFAPLLASPNGILYLTGPTGSGKTTTLYMMLEYLSKKNINISTIEDPVEKNLPRVNQMQVNNQAGLSFGEGLRALLRQDPDVIMIGETRDAETASISVRAAITGHLVFSTLHTNSAISSIVRLMDMGLEPYLIANSVVGIVAQRLMRKVCPECGEEVETTESEREILGQDVKTVMRAKGCSKCNHTGYKNRVAIHEIAVLDKQIREMVAQGAEIAEIERYAVEVQGMKTLAERAAELVRQGVTTLEEYWKIAFYV